MKLVVALLIWSFLSPWYIRPDSGGTIQHAGLDINAPVRVPLLEIPLRPTNRLAPEALSAVLNAIMRAEAPWSRMIFPEMGGETSVTLPGRLIAYRAVVRHALVRRVNPLTLPRAIPAPASTIKRSGLRLNLSRFSFSNISPRPAATVLATEVVHRHAEEPLTTTSFNGAGAGGTVEPVTRVPVFANTWYVRTDGGSTSRCTGLVNAPDPGSGTAQPCAYSSLQNGLDAVVAGDTVSVRAGDTFDGTFTVPNKSCTSGSPCIVKSSALASLPAGRVGPANAANMPRLRSLGGGINGSVIQLAANADYWTFDGFELTDNAARSANISWLIDASLDTVDHLTIQHCWIHQKETGTNYQRTVQRGIEFEGDGLTFKYNYLFIIGYFYSPEITLNPVRMMDTNAVLMVGQSKNALVEDNYISTWWNMIFTGGADGEPQNTANLTSATTGSATFDNTTGLTAGVMLRLEFTATGTFTDGAGFRSWCSGDFPTSSGDLSTGVQVVRSSGFALSTADTLMFGKLKNAVDSYDLVVGLCVASGNNYTIARARSSSTPTNGTVTLTIYETALVTSVVGSTVNYSGYGFNSLASSGATKASWNYGDQGLVSDFTVRKNTFYIDPAFAHDVYSNTGNSPKGVMEIKNVNRFTLEGNYVLGYPSVVAIYPTNQYGTAPWSTARDITIRNNWIAPDLGYPESTRNAIGLIDQSNYSTVAPRGNYFVYNNFIKNTSNLSSFKSNDNVQVYHNTVLNGVGITMFGDTDAINGLNSPVTNFVFRDNIIGFSAYGVQCQVGSQATCFPSATWANNVVVQNDTGNSGTIHCGASSEWGNNAALCPVVTSYSSVGFTNLGSDVISLTVGSSYHNAATDGTDPGVNYTTLLAALGAPPTTAQSVIGGSATIRGGVTIH